MACFVLLVLHVWCLKQLYTGMMMALRKYFFLFIILLLCMAIQNGTNLHTSYHNKGMVARAVTRLLTRVASWRDRYIRLYLARDFGCGHETLRML